MVTIRLEASQVALGNRGGASRMPRAFTPAPCIGIVGPQSAPASRPLAPAQCWRWCRTRRGRIDWSTTPVARCRAPISPGASPYLPQGQQTLHWPLTVERLV